MRKRKRNHRVELALNDNEYEMFISNVRKCGLTQQAYLLLLVNNKIPKEKPNSDFNEVITQLRRIGNNINQLAIVAHRTGQIDKDIISNIQIELNNQILEIRKKVYLPEKDV